MASPLHTGVTVDSSQPRDSQAQRGVQVFLTNTERLTVFVPSFRTLLTNMTSPSVEIYYQGYANPTADNIITVDGGVKLRVHSYFLKAP